VRLVEIEGVDLNTCGGTHVDRLSRIQMIRILEAEPARGGTRIRFVAGNRVLARLRAADALARDLKDRLATAPEEFARTLDAWVEERRTLARRTRDLEAIVAASLAERIAAGEGDRLFAVVPIASTDLLRSIAFAVVERRPGAVVALVGSDPGGGDACLHVQSGAAGPPDVAPIGARLRAALGARGGGRGRTFQGRDGRWTGGDAPPAGLFES
jgi:alanyl-tRNA synthetase